ncbi:hypothetical protein Tfer_1684 [Thermincola ferriacetica]|uniref:Uncharacterized protein n=1 Tax=Thermincola ferriacetica TaxID=281456 RepID=A0A0L6W2R2_9FIRM|nr:hypothetical protein Tfer_1684 [Thermincola ferriacetica]
MQGFQESDIIKAAVKENVFQVNTESKKIASTIIRRLRVLNEPLPRDVLESNMSQVEEARARKKPLQADLLAKI